MSALKFDSFPIKSQPEVSQILWPARTFKLEMHQKMYLTGLGWK